MRAPCPRPFISQQKLAKAKRAYAWSHRDGKDDIDEEFVAVLELPPVVSPQSSFS
jgi:hypothetical protein